MSARESIKEVQAPAPLDLETISSEIPSVQRPISRGPRGRTLAGRPRDRAEKEAVLARQRARFEQALQLNRRDLRQWMRYAQIEIESRNFDRARSIFERGLAVDYTYVPLWLRYAQTEISWRQFAHARAIFDRSVALLPQEQKLWLAYIEMEDFLDNLDACRTLFEKWRRTGSSVAYKTWLKFEKSNDGDADVILDRWVEDKPGDLEAWACLARDSEDDSVYGRAIDLNRLNEADRQEAFSRYAGFEFRRGEFERSNALSKLAGLRMSVDPSLEMFDSKDVEAWWAEISFRAERLDSFRVEMLFDQAVSSCLPSNKNYKTAQWRKYALLWLRYALHVEKYREGLPEEIYARALNHWPHREFTSATLWIAYAEYMVRSDDIEGAREVYKSALDRTYLNPKICKSCIALEKKLLSTDKVRRLYNKCCQQSSAEGHLLLLDYARFESSLKEDERARMIMRAGSHLPDLKGSDTFWRAWAEMEADGGHFDEARNVWMQAVEHCSDEAVDLWVEYAMFEISTGWGRDDEEVDTEAVKRARDVFERAFDALKQRRAERVKLYELFIQFEETYGTSETLEALRQKAPRPVTSVDGDGVETVVYEFSEAEPTAMSRLLANARRWAETGASSAA